MIMARSLLVACFIILKYVKKSRQSSESKDMLAKETMNDNFDFLIACHESFFLSFISI